MTLTPSHIIEYLYCARFTYFEYVLSIPQYEERNYKVVRGRELHDLKLEQNKGYIRQRIGAVDRFDNQYLTNDFLRGRIDEILVLSDQTMAPLDYKFASFDDRIYETYKTQLYCYAWLIEENYNVRVNCGFLIYTRTSNKLIEVPINDSDKDLVKECTSRIAEIIECNLYPKATKFKQRCVTCTYKNICTK